MDLEITDVKDSDFAEIQKIYAYYVENTTISLEEIAPSIDVMRGRQRENLPYLVARINNRVAGFAYAIPYGTRSAYRYTLEESIYVSKDFHGYGVGRKLLEEIIKRCREKGFKQLLAVIAGADNKPSIKFHSKLGFQQSGVLKKFGFKFGGWIDVILMQKDLDETL